MKLLAVLVLASTTAAAAPACPRDKTLPVEIPAVGCPKKVALARCSPCLKNMVALELTYEATDGGLGAWREGLENAGWKVTAGARELTATKGHDRASASFRTHAKGDRIVSLTFQPG